MSVGVDVCNDTGKPVANTNFRKDVPTENQCQEYSTEHGVHREAQKNIVSQDTDAIGNGHCFRLVFGIARFCLGLITVGSGKIFVFHGFSPFGFGSHVVRTVLYP